MTDDDQDMYTLLGTAGRRAEPDPAIAAAIRQATEDAWLQAVQTERRRKWRNFFGGIAAAAAVVLAVIVWLPTDPQPQARLAMIENVAGTYTINERARAHAEAIRAGDQVRTGHNSHVSLRLNDATLISLDDMTEVTFAAGNRLTVKQGRIFVDSSDGADGLVVTTAWGNIRDVGTQFEVDVSDERLAVALREGKVELGVGSQTHTAEFHDGIGELIEVDRNMAVSRNPLPATDPHWEWTLDTRSPLNIEGMTVAKVIDWSARVTGRTVVYKSDEIAAAAGNRYLSGGLLQPREIDNNLPYILKSAALTAKISTATILVDDTSQP